MLQKEATGGSEVGVSALGDRSRPNELEPLASARVNAAGPKVRWRTLLAVPIAALVTLGVHFLFWAKETPIETHSYALLYWEIIAVSVLLIVAQKYWVGLRRWMAHMCPI